MHLEKWPWGLALDSSIIETSTQERDQPNAALQVFNLPANIISTELGVDARMVEFTLKRQPWETPTGEIKPDLKPRF